MAHSAAAPEQTHKFQHAPIFIDASGDVPFVIVADRVVSLRALAAMTPHTLHLLERLADPEMNGQVVRIEHVPMAPGASLGGPIRLVKIGIATHVLYKAVGR